MMLTIRQPVGVAGANRPEDVVVIQLMLKLLHSGTRPGPFYKGKLDGNYRDITTAAIQLFEKENAEELSVTRSASERSRMFRSEGASFKLLKSYLAGESLLRQAKLLSGTPILYVPKAGKLSRSENGHDYLLPATLEQSIRDTLTKLPFYYGYKDVRLAVRQKFRVQIKFPGIEFVDPWSGKLSSAFPDTFQALLKKAMAPSLWDAKAAPNGADYVQLEAKEHSYLWETLQKLDQNGPHQNVFSNAAILSEELAIIIPAQRKVVALAARIEEIRCAGVGPEGGVPQIDAKTNKLVDELLATAPRGFQARLKARCRSCKELGDEIKRINRENPELVLGISSSTEEYFRFVRENLSVEAYETLARKTTKQTLTVLGNFMNLPIDLGELADGNNRLSSSSAADAAGVIIDKDADQLRGEGLVTKEQYDKIKQQAGGVKLLGKLMDAKDLAVAIASIGELAVGLPQYLEDIERMEKAYQRLRLNIQNKYIELAANDLLRAKAVASFEAKDCHWTYAYDGGGDVILN